jgi:putative nucleotidyltransferase with HDIG domain
MINRTLCEGIFQIIGEPLYLVGGSLRDTFLNKEPKDYDFTTPLSPDEIEAKIKIANKKAYCIGKRFGTIGMKIENQFVEITTFRTEKYDKNNRKPHVKFVTSVIEDLSRRDFTINAIAKRIHGQIIDPFHGKEDLDNKIIKTVGKATTRFDEDPLRLLRAVRFASQLGFVIEPNTLSAMIKTNYKILHISKERWMQELDKILLTDKPSIGLEYLAYTHLLHFLIPELSLQINYNQSSKWHRLDLWNHTLTVVDATPNNLELRWAALLHDIGKPFVRRTRNNKTNYIRHDYLGADIVTKLAFHLKWSNDRREKVVELVKTHMQDGSPLREYDGRGH